MQSSSLRTFLKDMAGHAGIDGLLRSTIVETGLIGERLQALVGRALDPKATILVMGSGRSGTTWLGDVLGSSVPRTRQIFEPLHPTFSTRVREMTGYDQRDPYLRSFYLRPNSAAPAWELFWWDVLAGQERSYWTDINRTTFMPLQYLVKEIRANLMAGFVAAHCQPKIVFVLRHPCAVIHSRLYKVNPPWYASVDDILSQEQLVEDHVAPWVDLIAQERDIIGAHAVWWAVSNAIALHQLRPYPHVTVSYEALSLDPEGEFRSLLASLGFPDADVSNSVIHKPTRMASPGQFADDAVRRLSEWQGHLSHVDVRRILDWAHRLGLDFYDDTPLSAGSGLSRFEFTSKGL